MSRRTIYAAIRELEAMDQNDGSPPQRPRCNARRVRRPGGGRPRAVQRRAGLGETFEDILDAHSAGRPTDPSVVWTDLQPMQSAGELLQRGCEIGRNTAARLLERAGYRRRSRCKELITGAVDSKARDQQFRHIDALRRQAHTQGNPHLCVDTEKMKLLGRLHRPGQCDSSDVQTVYDHDFRHLANGVLVPHGIFDYFANVGFMTLGTSRETSVFVCEAIALAWEEYLQFRYPNCTEIFFTFDRGGADAACSLRFKEDLVALSARVQLPLRVAHYSPYTCKWYPIEDRLFSHVKRALRGVILGSRATALEAVQRTGTQTGLRVNANILDKVVDIGRKCSDTFRGIKDKFIHHDDVFGHWNYVIDARGFA